MTVSDLCAALAHLPGHLPVLRREESMVMISWDEEPRLALTDACEALGGARLVVDERGEPFVLVE
jgi:hypothetical protein